MIIPEKEEDRDNLYLDLKEKCLVSLQARRAEYSRRRDYFLYGSGGGEPARFNKIRPQLETLNAFIYSAETTRFSINVGASLNEKQKEHSLKQVPSLNRSVNDNWIDTNADQVFRLGVLWGSVFNSMFIKLQVRDKKVYPFLVEPSCFGVLREDKPFLDQQEAFIHQYYSTVSELAGHLINHPRQDAIIKAIKSAPEPQTNSLQENVNRMLISQIQPDIHGVTGNPWDWNQISPYSAEVAEDVIEMYDLWIWDDKAEDYRCVTIADPGIKVYDNFSSSLFLKAEHPFIQICPDPLPDYFWGFSDVEKLGGLQDMYNIRIEQIIELLNKQVKPPHWGRGVSEEQLYALNLADGFANVDDAGTIAEMKPDIPDDLFRELDRISDMFSEALGINNVLAGRGESGVRSKGHAAELARLGSARIKQRALIIEDSLEKMASLYLKTMQKYDDTTLYDADNMAFIAKQFTKDNYMKVDAHSNSPVFMEDSRSLAFELFKAGVLLPERLIELVDPPMRQQILEDLKEIKAQKQQQSSQQE